MTKPGPIQIRNAEVVENIRELARLRGAGLTEAVEAAVRETLERERASRRSAAADRDAEIDAIVRRFQALPRTGPLLTDDDLYGEDGLPK